jgi:hypothetical protein
VRLGPDYLGVWLPGSLISGAGIGLTFPVLSAAAVSSLQQERFAVGSAVNQTARQIGGALGVAILVVVLGVPNSAAQALTNFHHLWFYAASMTVLSGFTSLLLHRSRAVQQHPEGEFFVAQSHAMEEMLDGEIVTLGHDNRAGSCAQGPED